MTLKQAEKLSKVSSDKTSYSRLCSETKKMKILQMKKMLK